jgi:hypothetical protein
MPNRGSRLEAKLDEYKAVVLESKPFTGDSLELLRAVYRGDYFATHDQIYAASQVLRFEHPPAVTVDGCGVEQIREEVRQEFLWRSRWRARPARGRDQAASESDHRGARSAAARVGRYRTAQRRAGAVGTEHVGGCGRRRAVSRQ